MAIFHRKSKNKTSTNVIATGETRYSFDDFQSFLINSSQYNGMKLSAVNKCVELISDTVSKIPFALYNDRRNEFVDLNDSSAGYIAGLLNLRPNRNYTRTQFFKLLAKKLLEKGQIFLKYEQNYKYDTYGSIRILDSNKVSVLYNEEKDLLLYLYDDKYYYPWEIARVVYTPDPSSPTGYTNPIEAANLAITIASKQEDFQELFYAKGGRPTGMLTTPTDLSSKPTLKDKSGNEITYKELIRSLWDQQIASGSGTAVLDNNMKYETVTQLSPKDMDLVATKDLIKADIGMFFKIPLTKLGVGKTTYSNTEQENIAYIDECIQPIVNQVCEALSTILLTNMQRKKGFKVIADTTNEKMTGIEARSNYYKTMLAVGAITPNEIRKQETLGKPSKDGDIFVIGPNSILLSSVAHPTETNEALDPTEPTEPMEPQEPEEPKEPIGNKKKKPKKKAKGGKNVQA